jgi:hypothetical protein
MSDISMNLVVAPIVTQLIETFGVREVVTMNLRIQLGQDLKKSPNYDAIMEIAKPLFTEGDTMHQATKDAFLAVVTSKIQ